MQVVATGHGFNDEFEGLDIVGRPKGVRIFPVDFVLARAYLMVAGLNFKAKSFQFQDNITTAVLGQVVRRQVKVATVVVELHGWLAFFI